MMQAQNRAAKKEWSPKNGGMVRKKVHSGGHPAVWRTMCW